MASAPAAVDFNCSGSQRGSMADLSALKRLPTSRRASGGASFSTSPTRASNPCLRPIQRIRNCSIASAVAGGCGILIELRQDCAEEAVERAGRIVFEFGYLYRWHGQHLQNSPIGCDRAALKLR